MPEFDPADYSVHGLLRCYGEILDELKQRDVLRTYNNPIGDYAEWLVAERLGLQLNVSSASGCDAVGPNGARFQIKARWLPSTTSSRQLSTIRGLADQQFDFLIAVLLNKDFSIVAAYRIAHNVIADFAHFVPHVNGHNLYLQGALLNAEGVDDITHLLVAQSSLPTSHPISAGKQPPVPSQRTGTPADFQAACIARVEARLQHPLPNRSRSFAFSADGKIGVCCACSKEYQNQKYPHYWYTIQKLQIDKLAIAAEAYLALGCGSERDVLLFPQHYLDTLLPYLPPAEA